MRGLWGGVAPRINGGVLAAFPHSAKMGKCSALRACGKVGEGAQTTPWAVNA